MVSGVEEEERRVGARVPKVKLVFLCSVGCEQWRLHCVGLYMWRQRHSWSTGVTCSHQLVAKG